MQPDLDIDALRADYAEYPSAAVALDALALMPDLAVAIVCEIAVATHPFYEAALPDACRPQYRMVYCATHQGYHLYAYSAWYQWFDTYRVALAELTSALGLPPEDEAAWLLALIEDMGNQVLLTERIREIPFRAWQRRQRPVRKSVRVPNGMSEADFRSLTRTQLLVPGELVPEEILLEFYQCYRKARFPSPEAARDFILAKIHQGYRNMAEQSPYECVHCGQYHVGHAGGAGSPFTKRFQGENATLIWNTYRDFSNRYVLERNLLRGAKPRSRHEDSKS